MSHIYVHRALDPFMVRVGTLDKKWTTKEGPISGPNNNPIYIRAVPFIQVHTGTLG